jgi:thiol-disulfide isomerase/thioredoxin
MYGAPEGMGDGVPAGGPNAQAGEPEGGQQGPGQQKKRWTGISMANLKEAPKGLAPDQIVQVTHVYRGSPGDLAGVKKGDIVIAANGQKVSNFRDVGTVTRGQPPGFVFTMSVLRNGKKLDFPVSIEERPSNMKARLSEVWEGSSAVPFKLNVLNAPTKAPKSVSLDGLKGKVVVLDFWATWCGPCRKAMPVLERLEKELGPKGLVVLGISSEEQPDIERFLQQNPLGYTIVHDAGSEVKQDYEVQSLPTLFVVDKKGIVRQVGVGTSHLPSLESTVRSLL